MLLIALLLFSFSGFFNAHAGILQLSSTQDIIPLGHNIETLVIHKTSGSSEWMELNQAVPNFGFTLDKISARLRINNPGEKLKVYIEHRYIHTDKVTINGHTQGDRVYRMKSDITSDLRSLYPLFPVTLNHGLNIIRIEVESQEIVTLPLYLRKQPPTQTSYGWLFALYLSALITLVVLLTRYRSKATIYYSGYILFFLINHFLIEGMARYFFPAIDWTYLMNEGYFLSAILYQIFLLCFISEFLDFEKTRKLLRNGKRILLTSSVFLFIVVLFLPYHWSVIPYFVNAGMILNLVLMVAFIQIRNKNRKTLYFTMTWIPSAIGLIYSLYHFFTNEYVHSFGYIIGGILQMISMLILFTLYPCRNRKQD